MKTLKDIDNKGSYDEFIGDSGSCFHSAIVEVEGIIKDRIKELEEEVKKLSSDEINIPADWEARVRIDELKKLLGEEPRERADITVHSEFDVNTKID